MKKGRFLIITGLVFIAAAMILTIYNFLDNYRAGAASKTALESLISMIEDENGRLGELSDGTYKDYELDPDMAMPVNNIDGIDYIGVLRISSIGIELPVISEWSYNNLKVAPCRYAGSAYKDDMVICAHNYDIHFGRLRSLSYGDIVSFTDVDGNEFTYEVIDIETLKPNAIEEMTQDEGDLTLFTCTFSGSSRVTIRCLKTE